MKITRTDKEYTELIKQREKVLKQTEECPCCGIKEHWLFPRIQKRKLYDVFYNYYFNCRCRKCGATWTTDEARGVL